MDLQRLQHLLLRIQRYIREREEKLAYSEAQYQAKIDRLTNVELMSALMENHILYTEHHKMAIDQMENLCRQIQDQLVSLTPPNR